jgi:hypothetical protein
MRLIWEWSVHGQESGDLHRLELEAHDECLGTPQASEGRYRLWDRMQRQQKSAVRIDVHCVARPPSSSSLAAAASVSALTAAKAANNDKERDNDDDSMP